jgi:hypothetical protein
MGIKSTSGNGRSVIWMLAVTKGKKSVNELQITAYLSTGKWIYD